MFAKGTCHKKCGKFHVCMKIDSKSDLAKNEKVLYHHQGITVTPPNLH